MQPLTPSRRLAAQVALVAGPMLMAGSTLTQPEFVDDGAAQLAHIDTTAAAISAVLFLVAQLPQLVVFLAIGLLLLPSAPRLSAWGTGLGVLGCFGHTVFGGMSMSWLVMAHDESHRAIQGALLDDMNASPVMVFSALGLLGTVLGYLLVSIGLFRTRTGPVWVGPALWAFLVVEFVGTNISDSATYLSVLLLALGLMPLVPLMGLRQESSAQEVAPAAV